MMTGHIVVTNCMVGRKVTKARRLYCLVPAFLEVVECSSS